jgi:ubiquinone/menaquinone biosynthesis C-methylase UbiE
VERSAQAPARDRLVSLIFRVWSSFYDRPILQKPYYRRVHAALLDMLDSLPAPRTALDLGCGTAQLTVDLAARFPGARVLGADLSQEMLAAGRKRGAMLDLVRANVYALPLATGAVDLVTNTISYHWYLDYERALAEIARVIAPGGYFVVGTISSPWFRRGLVRRTWEMHSVNRTRVPPPEQVAEEISAAGFRIEAQTPLFPMVRLFAARREG